MSDAHEITTVNPAESDPKSAPTFLVGAVSIALLVTTILLLEVMYHRTASAEFERKVIAAQPEELRGIQAEQLEQLKGLRWVDQQQGVATIPIEKAMELVIREAPARQAAPGAGR